MRKGVMDDTGDAVVARVRALCIALPGTSETRSWGHPNFRTKKGIFVTCECIGKRSSIAFRLQPDEVQHFLTMKGFFVTPYGKGRWVSLETGGRLNWKLITTLIKKSYAIVS
jgi:predicted DNA-binding protein (MmcQ/YjbR family)